MVYCVSTMYKGSVKCQVYQTAQNSASGMPLVHEGVVTGLWDHKKCKVCMVPCKVLMFYWLPWMNESLVVEFHVFPTKVNHILTWGLPWKFGCKINTEWYKILYIGARGHKCVRLDGVYFCRVEWHEVRVILWILRVLATAGCK